MSGGRVNRKGHGRFAGPCPRLQNAQFADRKVARFAWPSCATISATIVYVGDLGAVCRPQGVRRKVARLQGLRRKVAR